MLSFKFDLKRPRRVRPPLESFRTQAVPVCPKLEAHASGPPGLTQGARSGPCTARCTVYSVHSFYPAKMDIYHMNNLEGSFSLRLPGMFSSSFISCCLQPGTKNQDYGSGLSRHVGSGFGFNLNPQSLNFSEIELFSQYFSNNIIIR